MADKIFVDGLRTFAKHEKAPGFVLGTLIITLDDLYAWAKANPDHITTYEGKKQIKLQMTQSDKGRVNLAVDTWKPDGKTAPKAPKAPAKEPEEDLPF